MLRVDKIISLRLKLKQRIWIQVKIKYGNTLHDDGAPWAVCNARSDSGNDVLHRDVTRLLIGSHNNYNTRQGALPHMSRDLDNYKNNENIAIEIQPRFTIFGTIIEYE